MKHSIFFITFFMTTFFCIDSVLACTGFAVFSNQIIYGMNFDFIDLATKFSIITNGNMKTFHLAFEKTFGEATFFSKTAGMNTKGLFASCQEQHPLDNSSEELKDGYSYLYQLYEKIDTLSNVDEIQKITDQTKLANLPGLNLHNLFADTTGKAIITEANPTGDDVLHMQGNHMVMTNFPNYNAVNKPYKEAEGMGADRYQICHKYIEKNLDNFSIENGLELLEKVANLLDDPAYSTKSSMVFDPEKNEIYIVLNSDFSKIMKASIEKGHITPWKGFEHNDRVIHLGEEGILTSDLMLQLTI